MTIAVVIHPGATGIPARLRSGLDQTGALGDIEERPISVVMVEDILPVVSHEQIVKTVVVVVAHAAGLAPTGVVLQARAFRDVGERAVTIVFEQTAMRLLALGKTFQAPSIDK